MQRLEALREWIADHPAEAGHYLIAALNQPSLEPTWRRIVIYAVDAIRFEDIAIRASLATALLHHATELRQSNSPDDLPAAMCAIRRAGSILPEDRVDELLPFMNPRGFVDTRLVALQAIVAIYSAAPPNRDLTTIADRAGDTRTQNRRTDFLFHWVCHRSGKSSNIDASRVETGSHSRGDG